MRSVQKEERVRHGLVGALLLSMLLGVVTGCILPNDVPTAVIDASRTTGRAPVRIYFDAYDSHDSDGSINRCRWDFGDGAIEYGKSKSHKYTSSGTFTVTLTVWDDDGATDSATLNVNILEGPKTYDFQVTNVNWQPSICWLIVSWPCLYVYATVSNSGPYSADVEIAVTAYNASGAVVGTGTLWGYACDIPAGQSFVVEGKIPDIQGPVETVARVEGRVVEVDACN